MPQETLIDFNTGLPISPTPGATGGTPIGQPGPQPGTPSQPPGQPVNPTPGATGGTPTGQPGPQPGTPEKDSYTRAELEDIVKRRLEREQLKYADYDELKKAAAQLKRLEDDKKTDEQKLREQLAEAQAKNQVAEAEAQISSLKATLSGVAGRAAEKRPRMVDPGDAYRHLDIASLTQQDDGTWKGVEEALDALFKDKPYLFERPIMPQVSPANPPRGGATQGRTDADRHREYFGGGGGDFWSGGGMRVVTKE